MKHKRVNYSNSNNNNEIQKNKLLKLKPERSSILDDFKDDANTYNDEWDDDYDTRSIEYSLPMSQPDELS